MKYILIIILFCQLLQSEKIENSSLKIDDKTVVQKIRKYKRTYNKFFEVSKKAIQQNPLNQSAHAYLGYYYMRSGSNYSLELSKFHFEKSLNIKYSSAKYMYMLSVVYALDGDFINSKKYFQDAQEFDKDGSVFNHLFVKDIYNMRRQINNYNSAIEADIGKKARKMSFFIDGLVSIENNKIQEAITKFEKLLKRFPKDRNGLYGLAISYQKDMQYDNAKKIYSELVEYYPKDFVGYLGYFEIQLMLDEKFEDKKVNYYLREFSSNTIHLAQFELLKVLRSAVEDRDYLSEFSRWNNYYKDIKIQELWTLDELLSWTYTINDEQKRKRLLKVLDNFKEKNEDE
jgi:tetratricopeptide (TPR) repeat protein